MTNEPLDLAELATRQLDGLLMAHRIERICITVAERDALVAALRDALSALGYPYLKHATILIEHHGIVDTKSDLHRSTGDMPRSSPGSTDPPVEP